MSKKTENSIGIFNPTHYIQMLMDEMGFAKSPEDVRQRIFDELAKQVDRLVMDTVTLYATPEYLDEALTLKEDSGDLGALIMELVKNDPQVQVKLIEALDAFYEDTLAVYGRFSKK
jgi:hypothetical protein